MSITISVGIKQSPKQEDAGLVLFIRTEEIPNIIHLNTGIPGGWLSLPYGSILSQYLVRLRHLKGKHGLQT